MVGHQLDHRLWRDHAHDHWQLHQGRVCSCAMGELIHVGQLRATLAPTRLGNHSHHKRIHRRGLTLTRKGRSHAVTLQRGHLMNYSADVRRRRRLIRLRRFLVPNKHPQVTLGVIRELTNRCNARYTHQTVSSRRTQVYAQYSEGTYTMSSFAVQNSKQKEPPQ
jgi:hypothetical protein